MFQKLPVDEYVPESIMKDVTSLIAMYRSKNLVARICAIHVEDFARLTEKLNAKSFMPYCPTLCGIPLTPWEKAEIGLFAVADDETPLTMDQTGKVNEVIL